MSSILDQLSSPLCWAVETVLVGAHGVLQHAGLPGDAGITWFLAMTALLVLLRLTVLPLAVAATKNAQGMVLVGEAVTAIRASYSGRVGAAALQRQKDDIRAVRHASHARQWKSLVPQLIQLPMFFALSAVLHRAQTNAPGVGPLTASLARSFSDARLLGAPFRTSMIGACGLTATIVLAGALTLIIGATQFAAQAVALRYNVTDQARRAPIWRIRPAPLFLAPPILVLTSVVIPIGLLLYLAVSSLWMLGQQLFLLWRYPLPTTRAHEIRHTRKYPSGK